MRSIRLALLVCGCGGANPKATSSASCADQLRGTWRVESTDPRPVVVDTPGAIAAALAENGRWHYDGTTVEISLEKHGKRETMSGGRYHIVDNGGACLLTTDEMTVPLRFVSRDRFVIEGGKPTERTVFARD